jgi:uncharacterized protein YbgA (DUF1722 family)/uncharacterized protein YbbK (DUF523 family)
VADTNSEARGEVPIRVLVSACLLGEPVRFDGMHKRDAYVVDTLGRYFELVRVCPEVEVGMGVPRETIRLVADPDAPGGARLVAPKSGVDWTGRMAAWSRERLDGLAALDLCGYVCKKDSPSSGMTRVKVYGAHGIPDRSGAGVFTRMFMDRFPLVPVEEEGRLNDPALRENFVQRVFRMKAWRDFLASSPDRGDLVAFHTDHKLLLLTHARTAYTELGRLVAAAKTMPWPDLLARYGEGFLRALAHPATRGRTTDVLLHMLGHFRRVLDADDRAELADAIAWYRAEQVPLVVPLTLFRHHLRRHEVPWLARQVFLDPHPAEMMLRNHV